MNGYLTRLIARANGSEAVVRPLLSPAFAGVASLELGTEPSAPSTRDADESEPTEQARRRETLPVPPARADLPMVARFDVSLDREFDDDSAAPALAHPVARRAVSSQAEFSTRARASLPQDAEPAVPRVDDGVEASAPQDALEAAQAVTPRNGFERPGRARNEAPPPGAAARVASSSSAPAASEGSNAEAPGIVRIAIGRIEIRANLPRGAAGSASVSRTVQAARRFSVTPKLTLEEYLKREPRR